MDEQRLVGEIDDYLRSLGATDEQIRLGWRESRIVPLAGDLVVAEGAHLTGADLAVRAGADSELVLSLWHTLGVAVPDEVTPMFTERDAELTRFLIQENPVGSNGHELLRVLGGSLARVAEAAVSLYVQTQEPSQDARDADLLAWARELVAVSLAALRL
ncbi:MAG TPA: hypothetical protein VHW93_09110, partial [Acidimicrobiales bacterium]|nr:hypothetical protein [Acidimicrobiales bacterium]